MRHRLASGRLAGCLGLAALWLACEASPDCPAGFAADPERTAATRARLVRHPEGRALVDAARPPVCWGEPEVTAIEERGVLLMDRRVSEAEAAARMGHLLFHAVEGMPLAEGCAGLDVAAQRESRAHALEGRLRHAFGAPPLDPSALAQVLRGYRARCRQ